MKTLSLVFLAAAAPAMLLSFFFQHPAAEWIFSVLVVTFPIALIAASASREGRLAPLGPPLLLLWIVLTASVLGMLAFAGQKIYEGFPASTVFFLCGMFLAPLALVSWAYARSFPRLGVRPEDLERVRSFRRPSR